MTEENDRKSGSGKSYTIGNIGAHARVAVGEHITWTENNFAGVDQGAELAEKFNALLKRMQDAAELDDDTRELSIKKTNKVAEELIATVAEVGPGDEAGGGLRRALLDAKNWLVNTASWAWEELQNILNSEAAQKTITNVTSTATKAAIQALLGRP